MSDYEAALEWYETLFAGPPTMTPTEGEAVWRLTDSASLYVVADSERAGKSLVTVAVRDLDELRSTPDRVEHEPGAPRCLIFVDPDGNTLKFFADA